MQLNIANIAEKSEMKGSETIDGLTPETASESPVTTPTAADQLIAGLARRRRRSTEIKLALWVSLIFNFLQAAALILFHVNH